MKKLNGREGWMGRRCAQTGRDLYGGRKRDERVIVLSTCEIAMRRMDRRRRHCTQTHKET